MSAAQNISCVEGVHRFRFDPGYLVCRFECSEYYARSAQNFCNSCKEMDFVLYHPGKRDLWLIEVKDYRFDARPRVRELVDALSRKVRDTLFLLRAGAMSAPPETPAEGISLRDMARMSMHATHLHLVFLLELGNGGLFAGSGILSNIKDLLCRQMSFIDASLICVPITRSKGIGPWQVTPAGGAHSSRVEKRIRRVQELHEKQKNRETRGRSASPPPRNEIPLWKRRKAEREQGFPEHLARKKRPRDV